MFRIGDYVQVVNDHPRYNGFTGIVAVHSADGYLIDSEGFWSRTGYWQETDLTLLEARHPETLREQLAEARKWAAMWKYAAKCYRKTINGYLVVNGSGDTEPIVPVMEVSNDETA